MNSQWCEDKLFVDYLLKKIKIAMDEPNES